MIKYVLPIFLFVLPGVYSQSSESVPGTGTMFSTMPHIQKFQKNSKDIPASYKDFKSWQETAGRQISLTKWKAYNDSPWRSYFNEDSKECAEQWFINLGPLGLQTLMHDKTWSVFKGQQEIFPKFLCDGSELIFNNFEVKKVKPGSPSSGKVEKGDFIIAVDNEALLSAQHTYIGQVLDNRNKRGLEIHAGQLLDKAEGRGFVTLTLLRLPDAQKSQFANILKGSRKWNKLETLKAAESMKVILPECEQVRINTGRGTSLGEIWLSNEDGIRHPLESSRKKGSDSKTPLEIPRGKWTLNFSLSKISASDVVIETSQKVSFPKELQKYIQKVKIDLPGIGSFGKSFDPQGEKAVNYARMLAHRIAVQQENDGSWKAKSYASPSFYTSACGLALLSTGDSQYDKNIKKAAHYVAYGPNQDKWTYSNGMWMLFLSEYYLRTKDESILPGLQKIIARSRLCVLNDYTAGHSIGKAGYGGSGYIGGGGVIALGFAAASYTPAMSKDDKDLLDRMLQRIQEIAPHGKVPYGRGGKKLETDPSPGQGGSCGTGPYFLASLIRGGTQHFTSTAGERYSTAPFGSAENGHATQTLHFTWAMLSSANCSDEAYKASMNAYLWKFTTLREYDGFINQNNYRTEYHNGDGVIGDPYWRTSGYLLILNAWKRNLAITGNLLYRSQSFEKTAVMFHRDVAAKNYYKRNWALAANVLGRKAPAGFDEAYSQLKSLIPDRELGTNLKRLLEGKTRAIIKDLLSQPELSKDISNAQICELLAGVGFYASCVPSASIPEDGKVDNKAEKKALKEEQKKLKKILTSGKDAELEHILRIRPFSINEIVPELDQSLSLEMHNIRISVKDLSAKYFKTPQVKTFKLYSAKMPGKKEVLPEMDVILPNMNTGAQDAFEVTVTYELLGEHLSYKTKIICPDFEARSYVPTLTKVKVKGYVSTDYIGQASTKVVLANGDKVGCETRFQPLPFIPAGAPVEFEISPDNIWAHVVRSAKLIDPKYNQIPYQSEALKMQQEIKLGTAEQTLEFSFAKAKVGSIYLEMDAGRADRVYDVFLKTESGWKKAASCEKDGWQYLVPMDASSLKIVFSQGKEASLKNFTILKPAAVISSNGFW